MFYSSSVVERAFRLVYEFVECEISYPPKHILSHRVVWTPPLPNSLKINCDAAIKDSSAAFACIIKDKMNRC